MKRFVFLGFLLILLFLRMDFLHGQNQNVTMSSQTITVNCPQNVNFYDPGGPSGNYANNLNITQTFISSNPNKCLKVTFNSFSTQQSYDTLVIYDGTSTSGYKMGVCSGTSMSTPFSFTSTSGALTFRFKTNNSSNSSGWSAVISCVDCPQDGCTPKPTTNGSPCSETTSAHPFCTDESITVTFPAGTGNNTSANTFFSNSGYLGCLYTSPRPAWYYMQVDQPGDLLIRIEQNDINPPHTARDVDFVCWGPFHAANQTQFMENLCCGRYDFYTGQHSSHHPTTGNHSNGQTGGYPFANQIDCSYDAASTEWCYIPNAQHGEWYLLLMTNYWGGNCEITFTLDQNYSTGNTNCSLLAPISYEPPCEGDTLVLNCENPVAGALYHWWGPGGWSAVTNVPTVSIPNANSSMNGTYYLYLSNVGNTSVDTSNVDVQIYTKPNVSISATNEVICNGESVTLQASGANTYLWSTSQTTASISVAPTTTTIYSVIGTSSDGCVDTAYQQITVLSNSTGDTSAIACDVFDWYEHHNLTESGTFTHTFTNAAGCDSVVTLHLTITGTLNAYISSEFTQICEGNSVTLTAMTGNASSSLTYLWNTGATTQSITMWPSQDTQYSVTITASSVCVDSAYQNIAVGQISYQTVFDTTCQGESYNNYGFEYTPEQTCCTTLIAQTHYFTVNNCSSSISLRLTLLEPDTTIIDTIACDSFTLNGTTYEESGTHIQHFNNSFGCDSVVILHLALNNTPDISITSDVGTICQGNNATLTASVSNNPSSSLSYLWSTNDNTASIIVSPDETTTYTVTVTTPLGCRDSSSHTVNIIQTPSITDYAFLCPESSSTLTSRPSSSYLWNTGETTPSISVTTAGTYSVDIFTDGNCPVTDTFHVITIKMSSVADLNFPNLCAGGSYPITLGQSTSNNIIFHKYQTVQTDKDTVFLPDAVPCEPDGCYYRSLLHINCFEDTTKVNSVEDIRYVRLNLEHSYSGELYIKITCPNGQKADILRFGEDISGPSISECISAIPSAAIGWQAGDTNAYLSTFFGLAVDDHDSALPCDSTAAHNAPGVGWNYCWSNNTTEGYEYAGGEGSLIYRTENVFIPIDYNSFNYTYRPSDVAAGSQFYHPDESFANLVGCTLNGDWYIEVVDGQSSDNGYLFEWEIAFKDNIEDFIHATVVQTNVEGPWITDATTNSFVLNPPADLPADTIIPYTLHCIGEYDCTFDTVINIPFHTQSIETVDQMECNSFTWKDSTYTLSTIIRDTMTNIHGCDSIVNIVLQIVNAPEVTITGEISFCPGSSTTLTAVTEETPISYLWSTGETTPSITVTETGSYTVTVTYDGGCTSESAEYSVFEIESPIINAYLSDMVAGDTQTVVIGQLPSDNLQYVQPHSIFTLSDTTFLPDGEPCGDPPSCSYKAYLEFSEFPDEAVIQSADDIRYLRLNMEHSSIIDLYISLTCPNGQKADILKKYNGNSNSPCLSSLGNEHIGWASGSNVYQIYGLNYPYIKAYFGNANIQSNTQDHCDPTASGNQPGRGWNYCWSNNTTEGYQYAYGEGSLVYRPQSALVFNADNIIIMDSSNVAAGTHFYHPDVSFDSLVGCPLNGTWTVEVLDGILNDNGYVFTSELAVAEYLTGTHYSQIAENNFEEEWVTRIDDSTFIITPPDTLEEDTEVAYTFTLTDVNGCTFDTTIYIMVYANQHTDEYEMIYEDELPFEWNDLTFTSVGCQDAVFQTVHGADSVVTMHLSVIYEFDTTVCETSMPYEWHNQLFTEVQTIQTVYSLECADSLEILILGVDPAYVDSTDHTVCMSDLPYEWHNKSLYEPGVYYDTVSSDFSSCDSVMILNLTLKEPTTDDTTATACESFTWHGETYTTSGDYPLMLTNAAGCDSVYTLHLTIYNAENLGLTVDTCDWYTWNGTTYYESGEYTYIHTDDNECTQVDTLYLTIHNATNLASTIDTCDWYTWNGTTYYESGVYTYTHDDENNCTQVDTLYLTIHNATNLAFTVDTCDWYTWNGTTYTATGDYIFSFADANGCTQVDTLHLTIHNAVNLAFTVDTCDWYTWNGTTYTVSGEYTYVHEDNNGCTQVDTLHLTIHNATNGIDLLTACDSLTWIDGVTYTQSTNTPTVTLVNAEGCDSVVTLHLTINQSYEVPESRTICPAGMPYTWNGVTFTEAGTQTATLTTINGCDSVVTMNLTVSDAYTTTQEVVLCSSELPYVWIDDNTYNESTNDPTFTMQAFNGCDSIVNLHLKVKPTSTGIDSQIVCDSLTWIDGVTYTENTNTPTFTLTNAVGCDSVVTLHLTVNYSSTGTDELTACDSLTWIDGVTYTQSTNTPTFTLTNAAGCDSVVTLHLTINYSTTGIDELTACDSLTWIDGVTYTQSTNTPTFTLFNAVGCDSVVTLHLTINYSNTGIDELTVCDSLTWIDGITYTQSTNTPTFTLTNAVSCDSVVTLHLTVNNSTTGIDERTVCDSLTWIDGITYTQSTNTPTFTLTNVAGCDSVVTLNLTVNYSNTGIDERTVCDSLTWIDGITYTQSTDTPTFTLTNVAGCDSVVTLHLTVNYSNTGIDERIVCDSLTWIDGITYTQSTNEPTVTLTNVAGCDSVVTLHLTVNYSNTGIDERTVCDSLTWIDGVTYTQSTDTPTFTLTNAVGCDSVVTLHLTVKYSTTGIDQQTVCDSFTWIDGVTYTQSTDTPTFTLTNAVGCDSVVTLHLTVNYSNTGIDELTACDSLTWIDGVTYFQSTNTPTVTLTNAAGCDSVVTLHLTINQSYDVTESRTICPAAIPYIWNGVTFTEAGTQTTTLSTIHNCDSIVTMSLTVSDSYNVIQEVIICSNEVPYIWIDNNEYYASTNEPTVTLIASNSCDSVVNLHLTVKQTSTGIDEQTACDSFTWIDGNTYTQSTNEPTFTLTNAVGCDSVVTLHLTVNYSNTGIDERTVCDSLTWIDGITYTQSTNEPTFTLTNAVGCDSVVTLHLTVNYSNTGIDERTVCDSLTWIDGVTYTQSTNTPTFTLTNAAGCDSVVTLHLTVNYSNTGIDQQTVCDSLTWIDGITYTQSTNTPTFTLTNAAGCDSVVTLHLTVNYSNTGIDQQTVCDSLTWIDGVTYTQSTDSPTFTLTNAVGCDSVVTLHLTVNYSTTGIDELTACDSLTWIDGVTYTQSTTTPTVTLTNAVGCDSVVTLHLTVNYSSTGIDELTTCDSLTWIDGVTYTQSTNTPTITLTNAVGCDSVVTLHLTVNYSNTGIDEQTACDSYTWIDGVTYTQSTNTPTFTLTNAVGCDSVVTLHLTIHYSNTGIDEQTACDSYTWIDGVTYTQSTNTPTFTLTNAVGCDSVVTLHLTIHYSTTGIDEHTACDSFTWIDGETYTQSTNTPAVTLTNAVGCDSVVTLHLTIHYSTTGIDEQTACDSYTWIDGVTYTQSTNSPTFTLTNAVGCDSVVTLHLTVNYSNTGVDQQTACDSYTWIDGITYTQSTDTPTFTLTNAVGCDSVVTLHLTVNYSTTGIDEQTACDSYTWIDGVTYTQSTTTPTFMLTNAVGCDSVVTLHLTINNSTSFIDEHTACDSYTWIDGVTYTQSTTSPTVTLTNAIGCDSVVTLHLIVNNSTASIDQHTVCDSLTWIDGVTYTQSTNTPTFTLTNAVGCDSVVTLHLTVNHSNTGVDQQTACDSYTWINGITYTQSTDTPTFTLTNAAGCDSVVTLHLTINYSSAGNDTAVACDTYTWNGQTYTQTGVYPITLTNAVGCDSVATLHLTVNPSYQTNDVLHLVQNQLPYYFAPSGTTIPVGSQTSFQFNYTTTAQNGCDSTITEQVYIHMNHSATFDTTVCNAALPLQWHGHTFTAASTVTDSLLTIYGSDSVLTYTVTVDMLSAAVGDVTHVICFGQSTGAASMTVTNGTAPLTYLWTNDSGATVSSTTQITNQPAGSYNFTVTDAIGCTVTVPVTLNTINGQMIPGSISGNPLLCFGDSLGLVIGTAAVGDGCVYQWQIATNVTAWDPAPGINYNQNYESTTLATDNFLIRRAWSNGDCGTLYSDTLAVSVWPALSDTIYDEICVGQPYQQHGFNISETETVGLGVLTSVKYYVSSYGCDSAVVLILTIYEPQETTINTEICEGAGYFENGFSIPKQETVGVDNLSRYLTLQTAHHCDSVIRLELSIIDTALHIECLTTDFCEDMSAELVAISPMTYYLWNTGDLTPNITVTSPGIYTVTASQGGCNVTARYMIETCEFQLLLPNAITPDVQDGINDYFCIPERALPLINLFEISIFNRWGQQVFYSTDKNFKWNGDVDGQIYYENVYNYVIKYTDSAGRPFRVTGSITVL